MTSSKSHGRRVILLTGFLVVAGFVSFCWLCARSPKITFLSSSGPGEWILYPKPPDGLVYSMPELSTEFHRSFNLNQAPEKATLAIRALKRSVITINGLSVNHTPGPQANWKQPVEFEISKQLRAGSNDLSITVFNSNGPPALWLTLDAGNVKLNTDQDWETSLAGAVWRKARLASQPVEIIPGNGLYGGENALNSLLQHLPLLLFFAALSTLFVMTGSWWLKRYQARRELSGSIHSFRFAVAAIVIMAALWAALFHNNLPLLPNLMGFDVEAHQDYINYIKTHRALPLATDGWEMCQAPLYYIISAIIVAPLKSAVIGDAAIRLLRILGLVLGIAQFSLVLLSLRILFPKQLGKQLFGFLLAACLPEHLYISQYVSNESMAAVWVTAAIYFCLRLFNENRDSWQLSAATGLCLGAALLTKVTAVLAVPFIGGAIFGWLLVKRSKELGVWMRTLGVVMLTCFAVCGWHYLRVWKHFGTPVVNDWDEVSGFAWWTDEGFHTAAYFIRFGECLAHPFYSGFHGFADGIYSTLWGDSLYGGMPAVRARPPWNYGLMAAGCLLALMPTVIILTGLAACVRRFLRHPEPVWFLLLGLPFTTLAALAYMNLKLPFYCNVKAFYGLMALLPICAFGAVGWDILVQRARILRLILCVAMGVWALNTYASFWINNGAASTHATRGMSLAGENDRRDDAIKELSEALRLDPHNREAKVSLAVELLGHDSADKSIQLLDQDLVEHPDDANGHLQLASILAGQGQLEPAIQHAERAIVLAPDFATPYHHLCAWFTHLGRNQQALIAGREGLRLKPMDPELHYLVASALASFTNHLEAIQHFRLACSMRPGWAEAHDQMGSSLAALGRWQEAASQFDKACQLKGQKAIFHDHLAMAYAQSGLFAEATASANKAIELGRTAGDASLVARNQELLDFCRGKSAEHTAEHAALPAHP